MTYISCVLVIWKLKNLIYLLYLLVFHFPWYVYNGLFKSPTSTDKRFICQKVLFERVLDASFALGSSSNLTMKIINIIKNIHHDSMVWLCFCDYMKFVPGCWVNRLTENLEAVVCEWALPNYQAMRFYDMIRCYSLIFYPLCYSTWKCRTILNSDRDNIDCSLQCLCFHSYHADISKDVKSNHHEMLVMYANEYPTMQCKWDKFYFNMFELTSYMLGILLTYQILLKRNATHT